MQKLIIIKFQEWIFIKTHQKWIWKTLNS